jgi:hypothetical protein
MADTITTITTFINSPPGTLTAGEVLATLVWKSFGIVATHLAEDANAAAIPISELKQNPAIGNINIGWTVPK